MLTPRDKRERGSDEPMLTVAELVDALPDVASTEHPGGDPIGALGDDAAGAATHQAHPELGPFAPRHYLEDES